MLVAFACGICLRLFHRYLISQHINFGALPGMLLAFFSIIRSLPPTGLTKPVAFCHAIFINVKSEIGSMVAKPSCADPVKCVQALEKEVTELKRCKEALENIASESSAQLGEKFFQAMVNQLAGILQADYAFIGHIYDQHHSRVKTIALCVDGKIADNIEYKLADTPCENVVAQKACAYPSHVADQFPQDAFLADMKVRGYVGVPLFDSRKQPLGLMAVLFRSPLDDAEFAKSILQIYAARSAAEIERMLTEKALKESEARYRILFNQMQEGFSLHEMVYDADGKAVDYRFLSVNPAFESLTGLSRESIVGRTVLEVLPNTESYWIETGGHVAQTGEACRIENFSGELNKHFEVVFFRPRKGQFACVFHDITDRIHTMAASKQSEEKFSKLFETSPIWMTLTTLDAGVFLEVNQAFLEVPGYRKEKGIGRKATGIGLWVDPAERQTVVRLLEKNKRIRDYPIQFRMKNGEIRDFLWSAEVLVFEGVLCMLNAILDITDRKKTEGELRRSGERFRAIADYTHDWENWIGPNGKLIWVNPAVERITGYSREEYLNLPDNLLHRLKAVFLEKDQEQVLTMLESGLRDKISGNDVPCRIRRRDGSIRWVSISYQPIYASDGSFLGLRSSIRDITDRKLMEEALSRREKELSEKSHNLAEVNQALKAMLDHREVEKRSVEESMRVNLRKLVFPYVEKMASRRLDDESRTYLNLIKSNLEELVAPLSRSLSSKYMDLTPAEIKVTDLLRQGKTSKEIASLLGVSTSSVSFHRYNIRKKFGLLNKRTNLSAYLKTLSN
jgi:PAS domain S-box-containing protein